MSYDSFGCFQHCCLMLNAIPCRLRKGFSVRQTGSLRHRVAFFELHELRPVENVSSCGVRFCSFHALGSDDYWVRGGVLLSAKCVNLP